MSRREPEQPSRRRPGSSRPIPAPREGASGPIAVFHRFLYGLYLDAGAPTLDVLERQVKADDTLPGSPARASIGRIFDWTALPTNRRDLIAVVIVLARLADVDEAWSADHAVRAWTNARVAPPPTLLGQSVEDVVADPTAATGRFSVHPVIEVDESAVTGPDERPVTGLPMYVPRRHDAQIREEIARAVDTGRPRAMVLIGGSSTGKTRACWEAIQALAHQPSGDGGARASAARGWRVWRPLTAAELTAGLTEAAVGERTMLAPRTVIWLNELQDFVLPTDQVVGEEAAAVLLRLLERDNTGPIVVLGTMWQDPYWGIIGAIDGAGRMARRQGRQGSHSDLTA